MQLAKNRTLTAGVALIGASAITFAPVMTSLPQAQLPLARAAGVQLAAVTDPVAEWVQVIEASVDNLGALGTQFASDLFPIVGQLVTNQVANLTTLFNAGQSTVGVVGSLLSSLPQTLSDAAQQIAGGQVSAAVQSIIDNVVTPVLLIQALPLSAALQITQAAVQNLADVVGVAGPVLNDVFATAVAFISPVLGTVVQLGNTAQGIVEAVSQGDTDSALSDLINAPAALANAFLNGVDNFAGVFSPADGPGGSGPIAALLKFRSDIADALKPAAPIQATASVRAPAASARTAETDTTESAAATAPADADQSQPARSTAGTKRPTAAKPDSGAAAPAAAATGAKTKGDKPAGSAKGGKSAAKAASARHRDAA